MLVFLNGKLIPEEVAKVSLFDRSFCLGDGVFEALPFHNQKLFLWQKHMNRLQSGAEFLQIKMPFSPDVIHDSANQLLRANKLREGMLRLQLSRGVGLRGYSIKGADSPTLVMTLHARKNISSAAKLIFSTICIPVNDPLSQFKTCSKLSYVVARTQADEQGADDALLLNTEGNIAEATSSNFFWIENKTVCTPPLESGALPGVTRSYVIDLCRELKIPSTEKNVTPLLLSRAEGAFLTSSGNGICEVSQIDGRNVLRSDITKKLGEAYLKYAEGSD